MESLAGGVGEGGSDGCEGPAADSRHGPDDLVAGPQGACADRGAARERRRRRRQRGPEMIAERGARTERALVVSRKL